MQKGNHQKSEEKKHLCPPQSASSELSSSKCRLDFFICWFPFLPGRIGFLLATSPSLEPGGLVRGDFPFTLYPGVQAGVSIATFVYPSGLSSSKLGFKAMTLKGERNPRVQTTKTKPPIKGKGKGAWRSRSFLQGYLIYFNDPAFFPHIPDSPILSSASCKYNGHVERSSQVSMVGGLSIY